jgi:hypothetical protein
VFDPLAVAMVIAANQALMTIGKGEKQVGKDEVVDGDDDDDDDDSLFDLMKNKLKSKVKDSIPTKEKVEVHESEVIEEEKIKNPDLYGEQKNKDPIEPPKLFIPKNQAHIKSVGAVVAKKK